MDYLITLDFLLTLLLTVGAGVVGVSIGWLMGHRKVGDLEETVSTAHLDKLTGLPDRAIVDAVLDNATRQHRCITVAVCDVNGLHDVNEKYGHSAGDKLLLAISHRLMDLLPAAGGVVGRSGGDEFWIITGVTPKQLKDAYTSNINGLADRAAVGIASSPNDGDPRHALECADIAMFSAKENHHPVEIYDHSLGEPEGRGEELPSTIRHNRRHDDSDRNDDFGH
jgi:diguanylate cyclase (GGDEF)-like protein